MAAFKKRFKNATDIMETQHGNLALSKYIETLPEFDQSKIEKMKLYSEEAYDKFIAYIFIQETDNSITIKLEEDLPNQYYLGVKSYPCNLSTTKNTINNYNKYVDKPNHPGKKKEQSNKY